MSTREGTPIESTADDSATRVTLELDVADVALLRDILDLTYRDLKWEIADTDNSSFKQKLQTREQRILALLDSIGGPVPTDPE